MTLQFSYKHSRINTHVIVKAKSVQSILLFLISVVKIVKLEGTLLQA